MNPSIPPRRPPPRYRDGGLVATKPANPAEVDAIFDRLLGDQPDELKASTMKAANPIPQPAAEANHTAAKFGAKAGLVGFGFALGVAVLISWAHSGPAIEGKPRAPDAENFGGGISRTDDWERGISCYQSNKGMSCVPMPSDAPAKASRLENVML